MDTMYMYSFLYVPLRFQQEVPAFQKYVAWIKSGGRWGVKIYQRLLEYIDLPTKTDNNNRRGCANILAHPLLS